MIQWVIVAIILAVCVLYVCRALMRSRRKGGFDCGCGCENCPSRRGSCEQKRTPRR